VSFFAVVLTEAGPKSSNLSLSLSLIVSLSSCPGCLGLALVLLLSLLVDLYSLAYVLRVGPSASGLGAAW
jgi:hypothetical protein